MASAYFNPFLGFCDHLSYEDVEDILDFNPFLGFCLVKIILAILMAMLDFNPFLGFCVLAIGLPLSFIPMWNFNPFLGFCMALL